MSESNRNWEILFSKKFTTGIEGGSEGAGTGQRWREVDSMMKGVRVAATSFMH